MTRTTTPFWPWPVAARAETIVNGDKDLLVLGSYADIPILSLAEAPVRIAGKTP